MTMTTPVREVLDLGAFHRSLLEGPPRDELLDDDRFRSDLTTYLDGLLTPTTSLLSVDVFDTVLARRPISELSRFVAIASRQALQLAGRTFGDLPNAIDLLVSRLQATHASYRMSEPHHGHREGSILQIHRAVERTLGLPRATHQLLIDEELAYEATATFANTPICHWLEARQRDGVELVLLSDMYLHAEHIRRLLDAHRILPDVRIISSADQKFTKHSGSAYPALLTEFELEPADVLHIGDNLRSDYQLARVNGIRSGYLPVPVCERTTIEADKQQTMDELSALGHDLSRWI